MLNKIPNNIKAFFLIVVLTILVGLIKDIPWWSFLIVVALIGAFISFKNWRIAVFPVGFLSGMVVWAGLNLYYHVVYGGSAFQKIGMLIFLNEWLIYIVAGIIGGLLTTLALYSGVTMIRKDQAAL